MATLHEANKVVELAIKGINDVHLTFPVGWIECGIRLAGWCPYGDGCV